MAKRKPTRLLLPILLATAAAGCAYYNTFFVAKRSYKAAEQSARQSKTDLLPSDAKRNYETAIDQCRKVLRRHPESRWADDALYLMAASYYGIGDYDSALVRLAELHARFPNTCFRPDALYLEGLTETKRRDHDRASLLFDEVLTDYPKFDRRDRVLYTVAEAAAQRRDKSTAIRTLHTLARESPKSPLLDDALLTVGQLYFSQGEYDSASIYFSRVLEGVRDEEKEIEAAIMQAQSLVRVDRAEEAVELLSGISKRLAGREPSVVIEGQAQQAPRPAGVGGDAIARIALQEAAALNHLGRHQDALARLVETTTLYSASNYAVEAQFQIGYTYETLLDSLDTARSAYDKTATMPGRSVFREQAMRRANALRSLAEMQRQQGSGDAATEARADAALRIAEIMYLDRNLIDEAVARYAEVEEEFPTSRAAPRAGYAQAYILWREHGDTLAAQGALRELVGRYPASPQARDAIDLLASMDADTSGLWGKLVAPPPDTTAAGEGRAGLDAQDSLRHDAISVWSDSLGDPVTERSRRAGEGAPPPDRPPDPEMRRRERRSPPPVVPSPEQPDRSRSREAP